MLEILSENVGGYSTPTVVCVRGTTNMWNRGELKLYADAFHDGGSNFLAKIFSG